MFTCGLLFHRASTIKIQLFTKRVGLNLISISLNINTCRVGLSGEASNTNIIVFGLTLPGLEPTIYRTRGEHSNHYATAAVQNASKLAFYICIFFSQIFYPTVISEWVIIFNTNSASVNIQWNADEVILFILHYFSYEKKYFRRSEQR
jgi:hypothetical protein